MKKKYFAVGYSAINGTENKNVLNAVYGRALYVALRVWKIKSIIVLIAISLVSGRIGIN